MSTSPIYFYGGPFSNFAPSVFAAKDRWGRPRWYKTVEHYFQAAKATTPEDHDYVVSAEKARQAKNRGREIKLRSGWDDMSYDVMLEGLRCKFALPDYKRQLLATGDRELREDSPTDFIWGYRNNGLNLLGKALMQIRTEIVEASSG